MMQNYTDAWMPCPQPMQPMCPPGQMMPMPEKQLEGMYPEVYRAVYPAVVKRCDSMDMSSGPDYIPTKEEVERMVNDIYIEVEANVSIIIKNESENHKDRQFGPQGRGLLRGLIGALLIRDLIRRRRRPFYGYPYGDGYGSPFYGGGYGYY